MTRKVCLAGNGRKVSRQTNHNKKKSIAIKCVSINVSLPDQSQTLLLLSTYFWVVAKKHSNKMLNWASGGILSLNLWLKYAVM